MVFLLLIAYILFDERLFNFLPTSYSVRYSMRFILVYLVFTFFAYSYDVVRLKLESELKAMNEMLGKTARTDPLTGIPNRRDIIEKIEYERYRVLRSKSKFSIILTDIDHFKNINDEYGHNCGDFVLKEIADKITTSLRKQDIAS